jgi:hypothetical protein
MNFEREKAMDSAQNAGTEKQETIALGLGALALAVVSGLGVAFWMRRRSKASSTKRGGADSLAGAYPKSSGATSAVTGGNPEDINEMPPALLPQAEGAIYDGSQL